MAFGGLRFPSLLSEREAAARCLIPAAGEASPPFDNFAALLVYLPEAMRVSEFDNFDSLETEGLLTGSKEHSWLWFGLIVSLGLHLALCAYFYRTRFQPVEAAFAQNQQTPTFKVRSIDESKLDKPSADQTNPAAKPEPDNSDVQLPDEKKSFDKLLQDIQASAAMPDDVRDVLPNQPKVDQPDMDSVLTEIERSTAQTPPSNANATQEQSLLNNSSVSGRPQPALSGTELAPAQQSSGRILSRANCRPTVPGRTKGALRALAIWISCWRKKVRSDRAQNCECPTINCSNMTALHCSRAPLINCKSLARSSSATRGQHLRSRAIRIHSAHLSTTSI